MRSALGIDSTRGLAVLCGALLCAACGDRPRSPAAKEISVAFLAPIGPRSSSVERTEARTQELLGVVRGLCGGAPAFVAGAPVRLPERIDLSLNTYACKRT